MAERKIPLLLWVVDPSGFYAGWHPFDVPVEKVFNETKQTRLPILNSPLAFPGRLAYAYRVSPEEARAIAEEAKKRGITIDSYVGHESTARLASEVLGVEVPARRAMYIPGKNEIALVFRLKKRLAKPEDLANVKPEDIEIIIVHYIQA